MMMRLLMWIVCGAWLTGGAVAAPGAGEAAKIEALIQRVEGLKDAQFIRNGSKYSSANAAKFLRGKWQAKNEEIHSAGEFVAKVGSVSSTTGQPYRIHFADGHDVKCGDYLTEELKKLK